jgi:hypothetical protein
MDAPDEFRCPITMEVMTDPVIGDDGQTYERAAIERALSANPVSPMTRQRMTTANLRPNFALRSTIQRWTSAPKPSASKSKSKPKPTAPPAITHTDYILLITPEMQAEQERLLSKPTAAATSTSVAIEEHRRRTCRVGLILCLFIIVLIFVFHALAS